MNSLQSLPIVLLLSGAALLSLPLKAQSDPSNPRLTPEQRKIILRRQERLWNVESRPIPFDVRAFRAALLRPWLREITGGEHSEFSLGRLSVSVPASAFPAGQRIHVEALVLEQPSDFVFSPVDLKIGNGSGTALLVSTGMFRITFKDGQGRPVRPVQHISVSLSSSRSTEGVRVYHWQPEGWQERSASAKPGGAASGTVDSKNPSDIAPFESPSECSECPLFPQIYEHIDEGGWWNFDRPEPEFTCVSVQISGGETSEGISVEAAGVDYQGISHGKKNGNYRTINVLKNHQILVFATASVDSRLFIGSLPVRRSPSHTAHSSLKNSRCPFIGKIQMREVSKSDLKTREKYLEAIGWPRAGI